MREMTVILCMTAYGAGVRAIGEMGERVPSAYFMIGAGSTQHSSEIWVRWKTRPLLSRVEQGDVNGILCVIFGGWGARGIITIVI